MLRQFDYCWLVLTGYCRIKPCTLGTPCIYLYTFTPGSTFTPVHLGHPVYTCTPCTPGTPCIYLYKLYTFTPGTTCTLGTPCAYLYTLYTFTPETTCTSVHLGHPVYTSKPRTPLHLGQPVHLCTWDTLYVPVHLYSVHTVYQYTWDTLYTWEIDWRPVSPNLSIYHTKILPCSQTSLSRRRHQKKASHIWQTHKKENKSFNYTLYDILVVFEWNHFLICNNNNCMFFFQKQKFLIMW